MTIFHGPFSRRAKQITVDDFGPFKTLVLSSQWPC